MKLDEIVETGFDQFSSGGKELGQVFLQGVVDRHKLLALLDKFLIRLFPSIFDGLESGIVGNSFVSFLHEFLRSVVQLQQGGHRLDDVLTDSVNLDNIRVLSASENSIRNNLHDQ